MAPGIKKAQKAGRILRKRFKYLNLQFDEIRTEFIGYNATHETLAQEMDEDKINEIIKKHLTAERVKEHFKGICNGKVERFDLPNLIALNFLLHNTLGGGGIVSLRHDAQGKTLAAALLRMEIEIEG